jgi:hypothetical protein
MVVMDDRIISARENRKSPRTGGFSGGEMGMLGVVAGRGPEFFFKPARRHGVDTEFDIAAIDTLPTVELVFSYPGGEGPRLGRNTQGVVAVTTSGFSPSEREAFLEVRRRGIVLVQSFPSGEHVAGGPQGPGPGPGPRGPQAVPQGGNRAAARGVKLPPSVSVRTCCKRILRCWRWRRRRSVRDQRMFSEQAGSGSVWYPVSDGVRYPVTDGGGLRPAADTTCDSAPAGGSLD